jgi:hypothetical protein
MRQLVHLCAPNQRTRALPYLVLIFLVAAGLQSSFAAEKPETPHLVFVTEYIRELAAIENIRVLAEQEQKQSKESEAVANGTHFSTLMQLELRTQIRILKGMHLNGDPFDQLIPSLTESYEREIELHQKMIDIESEFIGGEKPGVDYGKLAAELPKIRAEMEYIEQAVFQATPAIFYTLVDPRPDGKNHVSHLVITKAERDKLVNDLATDFGSKLDKKDQNYEVSAAQVLMTGLSANYKCSDEPWE